MTICVYVATVVLLVNCSCDVFWSQSI